MATRKKKPEATAPPEAEFKTSDYNKVVDSAALLAIQTLKVSFDVNPDLYENADDRKYSFDRGILGATFDAETNAVASRFLFRVTVRRGRTQVLKATAEYMVGYSVHQNADPAAAEEFARRVGIFAAYPYFRALVAHLSWESNANLPILPVMATRGSRLKALEPPPKAPADG